MVDWLPSSGVLRQLGTVLVVHAVLLALMRFRSDARLAGKMYHCLESVFGEILLDMVFEKRFALFLLLMGNYEQMSGEIDDGRRHL
ncbi:hypothetical protein T07_5207 [Trichinella nelsoni]|uniref:Uncharacterized protein n=1 Tax=Trichinella nelsoni TaxID=6336 RepID=A0A0V0S0D2_9BILA|nr:hypothetical protein T07_5207 [Trichinella nelsoni]